MKATTSVHRPAARTTVARRITASATTTQTNQFSTDIVSKPLAGTNGSTEIIVASGLSAMESVPKSDLLGLGLLDEVSRLLSLLPLWQTVGEGEPLTLSIGVDVIGLVSLQWYFNGQPIAGANKGTLIIPSVRSAQVGRYELRATLLGITLASVPTDVQINETDGTVDRSAAAFDHLTGATAQVAATAQSKQKAAHAKSGSTAHGFSGTQIFSTVGATMESGEPNHCGIPGGASEWFAWQPPTNGTALITTDGSTFDTVLAVYVGPGDSYTTLTNIACDNDAGANSKTSRVMFQAKAGTIYYIAVDGVNGTSGTVQLSYTVGAAPAITGQPASRTVALGSPATLSAAASGSPALRYQWTFNGTNIANATNAWLSLPAISNANLGSYRVHVTNAIGSALSSAAEFILETPLRFSSRRLDSAGFHLSVLGPAATNYVIDCSTNLSSWTALFTNRTQTGLFDYVDPAGATKACLFYRVRPTP